MTTFLIFLRNVAGEKQNVAEIAPNDIQYLIDNPEKIDTKDEFVLELLVALYKNYDNFMKQIDDYITRQNRTIANTSDQGSFQAPTTL